MKRSGVYFCLAALTCLVCFFTPFNVFAKGSSRPITGSMSITSTSSNSPTVHTTNILNGHYVIPPKGFNPLKATNAELEKYHFPKRPKNQKKLKQWKQLMAHAAHFVAPVFGTPKGKATSVSNEDLKNWSGYEVRDSQDRIHEVYGQWSVPDVNNSNRKSYSVTWIGMGGDGQTAGASQLIQEGTRQDYINGAGHYSVWWERLTPKSDTLMVPITNFTVAPDQDIEAEITVDLSTTTYFIENTTTGKYTSFTESIYGPHGASGWYGGSAEWIEERESINNSYPYLADYRIVNFFNCSAYNLNGSFGGSIGGGNWSYIRKITMYEYGTYGAVMSTPTSLINSGKFAINWKNYG